MVWGLTLYSLGAFTAAGFVFGTLLIAWRQRSNPAGREFVALLAAIGGWSLAYGFQIGYATLPGHLLWQRLSLAIGGVVPTLWLLFTARYGLGGEPLSKLSVGVLSVEPIVWAGLVLTNPSHGLVWSGVTFDPLATPRVAEFSLTVGYYVHIAYAYLLVTLGLVFLFNLYLRGSRLYRAQSGYLIVGAIPPFLANIAYTLRLEWGPLPALDPTPFAFGLTGVLFATALYRVNLVPKALEHTIQETTDGFVVVDADDCITSFNPVAEQIIGANLDVGAHISEAFPQEETFDVDAIDGSTLEMTAGGRHRVFEINMSPLTDHHGRLVGRILKFDDVTARAAYEQRLEVSNRVLRHNLRNELNIVQGIARSLADGTTDDEMAADLARVDEATSRLLEISDKARSISKPVEGPMSTETVGLASVVEPIIDEFRRNHPDVHIETSLPADVRLEVPDRDFLAIPTRNLIENAIVHNDTDNPRVSVKVDQSDDGTVTFEVVDNGPGIPEIEQEVLEEGSETALMHGSGLGLWLVNWGISNLGGEVQFAENNPRGSVVSVRLPTNAASDFSEGVTIDLDRQQKRDRLLAISDAIPDAAFVYDADGRYVEVLTGHDHQLSAPPDQLIGSRVQNELPSDVAETLQAAIDRTLETGRVQTVEYALDLATGRTWFEGRLAPIPSRKRHVVMLSRDITERKRRERELERYETIIDALGDPVYALDEEGRYTFVNDAFVEQTGHERTEIIGETASDVILEEYAERGDEVVAELLRSEDRRTATWELERVTPDGDIVPAENHVALLPFDDGEFQGTAGVIRDIGERRERQRELQQYRTLVDAVGDPMFLLDENGEIRMANDAMVNAMGVSAGELVDRHASDLLADGDFDRGTELIRELLAADDRRWGTVEVTVEPVEGEPFPAEVNLGLLYEEDGSFRGSAGVVRDLSERAARAETLERLHRATRSLVTAETADAVAREVAEAATEVLGHSAATVLYWDGDELVPAYAAGLDVAVTDLPITEIEEDAAGDAFTFDEVRVCSPPTDTDLDYPPNATSVMYVPIGDAGIVCIADEEPDAFDAADESLVGLLASSAETALDVIDQRASLRRQNERLSDFASVVSHDLRNPLNVAEGRLELARDDCDSPHLDEVDTALDRMSSLIDELLSLARSGDEVGDRERIDLDQLVQQCWATVETGDASLVVQTDRIVSANRSRLRQLFENLVRNAVEHGGEDVTVTVGDLGDGFYVEDDGTGIPTDAGDRIFEAGYSTSTDGTGFGLSIVREIADAHGWEIRATSGTDGGARFEVSNVEDVDR